MRISAWGTTRQWHRKQLDQEQRRRVVRWGVVTQWLSILRFWTSPIEGEPYMPRGGTSECNCQAPLCSLAWPTVGSDGEHSGRGADLPGYDVFRTDERGWTAVMYISTDKT
jgi:hypothetical protein